MILGIIKELYREKLRNDTEKHSGIITKKFSIDSWKHKRIILANIQE